MLMGDGYHIPHNKDGIPTREKVHKCTGCGIWYPLSELTCEGIDVDNDGLMFDVYLCNDCLGEVIMEEIKCEMGTRNAPGTDYDHYHAMKQAAIAQGCVTDNDIIMPAGGGLTRRIERWVVVREWFIFDGELLTVRLDHNGHLAFFRGC